MESALERMIPADGSKPLRGSVFADFENQAYEVGNEVLTTLMEERAKLEQNAQVTIKAGEGVGLLEAPRGTLYYMLSIDSTGKVKYGNIIVPTQQNQIGMEKSIVQLVEQNINSDKKKIEYEIEKLIRAYDPCMSCASHFLRINWK
ncbi:MAG: nickel-dependent hydrogenase large subunit [Candidatus Micrarchaeales archaeon]